MAWWAALGKVAGSIGGGGGGALGGLLGGGGGGQEQDGGLGGAIKKLQGKLQKVTGAAIGAGQAILGVIQKRKADAMLPSSVSAAERNLIAETGRMRRAAQTNIPWAQMASSSRDTKMAMDKSFKMGGRNIGALNAALENAKSGISAQAAQQAAALLGQEAEAQKYAGSVVRDVQLLRSARKSADAASNIKGGLSNMFAAISPKATAGEDNSAQAGEDNSAQAETSAQSTSAPPVESNNVKKFKKKASKTIGDFGINPYKKNNGLTGPASNGLTNIGL